MIDEIRQGNVSKLVITLTENGSAFAGLSGADLIRVGIYDYRTKSVALEVQGTDPNITLDDGGLGILSWQLTSAQTTNLALGAYGLAVQTSTGGNVIEWDDALSINVVSQVLT